MADSSHNMSEIHLNYDGPYTLSDEGDSVFRCQHAKTGGIYLWTVRQEDGAHLIHYIGETVRLGWRHREHLVQVLGLNYGIFDINYAREGKLTPLWKGLWRDKTADGPGRVLAEYPGMTESVISYLRGIEIFFAPFKAHSAERRHVEGVIGHHLRTNRPEWCQLYPADNQVGPMKSEKHGRLRITATGVIRGLDAIIEY